jgi:predicted O-linked N-acetylglucosamine transferase (SPINDLY family)
LICFDVKTYEERAVALGGDTLEMAKCKRNVVNAKTRGNLFNTPGFVKTLEGAFLALV